MPVSLMTIRRLMAAVAVVGMLTSVAGALAIHFQRRADWEERLLNAPIDILPSEWFVVGVLTTGLVCLGLALERARRNCGIPLMTTRHLIATVALAAVLASGAEFVRRRSRNFEQRARLHEVQRGSVALNDLELYLLLVCPPGADPELTREYKRRARDARPLTSFIEYHERLVMKYEDAAHHPWRFVATDPPLPPRPTEELQKALRARARDSFP